MKGETVFCGRCGRTMRMSKISIDTSGSNFKLTLSGIPVYACDNCRSSLHFLERGPSPEDIAATALTALDRLTPSLFGAPIHTPNQCCKCRADLAMSAKLEVGIVQTSERLDKGTHVLVVRYRGPVVACPNCGTVHPVISPVTYHEVFAGIRKDGAIYIKNRL